MGIMVMMVMAAPAMAGVPRDQEAPIADVTIGIEVPSRDPDWYWKDYNGADPGGYMPDYDQFVDRGDPDTVVDECYCAPNAVGNSILWFHHKYSDHDPPIVPADWDLDDLIYEDQRRRQRRPSRPPGNVWDSPRPD